MPRRAPVRCAGVESISRAAESFGDNRPRECRCDLGKLRLAELWAVMSDTVEDVRSLEVLARAVGVNVTAGIEAVLLEEDEREPPFAFRNELAAAAAVRAPRCGPLGAAESRNATVRDPEARGRRERLEWRIGGRRGLPLDLAFEEWFGPRISGAGQMKPQRHFAFAESVRLTLAEPKLALGDRLLTAAAFGAAARRGFDDMSHLEIIEGCACRSPLTPAGALC